ncbi:aminomethyl-transferring glycine dehydrogenase [Dermabacteraceae bacterium P7006]
MASREEKFLSRHVGPRPEQQEQMLAALGLRSLDELLEKAVPGSILLDADAPSLLPQPVGEDAALAELRALAGKNRLRRPLLGQGYYGTRTPHVIVRNVIENPAWYTAYTPYQPEISQGRLEALLNFQTMVSDLTALPVANSSLLDEATAAAEAMLLARRAARGNKSARFLLDSDVFPATEAVMRARAEAVGIELVSADLSDPETLSRELAAGAFGVLVQYPAASGRIWDPAPAIAAAHEAGAQAVVAADLLALTLLRAPGELGADIAVGSTQRFGVPLGYGGPHAGYMSVRSGLERQIPGRLVGVSRDAEGRDALRLALQTREQHIRRDKATSNICTAQVLLAVVASMYAVYHGPEGLRGIARGVAERTVLLAELLRLGGCEPLHANFFDTLRVSVPGRADELVAVAADAGYLLLRVSDDEVGISLDETVTEAEVRELAELIVSLGEVDALSDTEQAPETYLAWADELNRESDFLTHPVFNSYRSETAMMRYLRRLSDMDFALDRGMIPLGSCTMKLNAAVEMNALTWPEFSGLHPLAPAEDAAGYRELTRQLESWLADVTGYDTVSLQPNAGSQGEYAGLLAIRAYHRERGDKQRDVCLVPASAHGTNAASAVLAGLRVVVVASDAQGNIDVDDLRAKLEKHGSELAAIMITYPSTHGVYEERVREVCELVHAAGGQVYVDGANLNALLEVARPGEFGGDVSHLNLHKTFCIPHGGGGPGVGPVAAKAHLAPYLPGHPAAADATHPLAGGGEVVHGGAPVAQAAYGSASVLPIPWMYVRMMGADGLRYATASAVLAANYVAHRLSERFEILYRGANSLVAHECIVDLREWSKRTHISVDDVAKRLIDYGFHAPTMSFPVAGTLMVEPTESEDLAELDRFCDAMLAIADEAEKVAAGEWPVDDNPLVNAPHTARCAVAGEWSHPYTREEAVYPAGEGAVRGKYWPPVRRVDNAYGDRNLACSCPSPEAFAESE